MLLAGLAAVAAVLVVAFALFSPAGAGGYTCGSQLAASSTGSDGVVTPDMGRQHVRAGTRLRYAQCPPSSGDHYGERLAAGFYGPETEQSPGAWVHSLEHGYVAILYSCGAGGTTCPSADELDALRQFQDDAPSTPGAQACGIPSEVLTVRFDAMAARFAYVAWDRVFLTDTFDAAAARTFAATWIDQRTLPEAANC